MGASFNLAQAAQSGDFLILVPLLIVAFYLVKLIPSALFRQHFSWREAISAGFLISSNLSLVIAAAAIGLRVGEISENTNGAIILTAIFTSMVSPLVFEKIVPPKDAKEGGVVIIGATEGAIILGERLAKVGQNVTVMDIEAKQRAKAKDAGQKVLFADAIKLEDIKDGNITPETTVVVTSSSDEINLKICRLAKEDLNVKDVISVVDNSTNLSGFQELGVRVVNPAFSTLMVLENLITHPTAFSLIAEEEDDLLVEEVVLVNRGFIGKALRDIRLPGDAIIMSISRNYEKIVPHGNTRLGFGDLIMLVGKKESVQNTTWLLGSH